MDADNPSPPRPPSAASEREFVTRLLAAHEQQSHVNQLNAAELLAVRELLESRRRWSWIVSSLKTGALWFVAVAAGWTVGVDALKAFIKSLGE